MRSGFDFQRTPTTTQSAVFSGFTFTTPSREPGRYARSRRFAITPSRPIASKRSSQPSASSRSRVAGESSKRFALRSSRARRFDERLVPGLVALPDEHVERDEARGDLGGELVDAALGRMQAHLHRVEVEDAVALDHDLAVERRERRQELLERSQLGEVAQQRPRVPRPEPELAGAVLEEAAEAVPLRLVLPLVALGQLADELGLHRRERDRRVRGRPAARPARAGSTRERAMACKLLRSRPHASRRRHRSRSRHAARARRAVDLGRGGRRAAAASTGSRSFDASDFPVRIASEVKGFEPEAVVGPKDARRLERNVVLAVAAAREAWADAGVDGVDPARAGILVGSAIGGVMGVLEQDEVRARARPRSRLAVVPPERARRLGERADRDRPRPARPELRAGLGVRDRVARGRGGRRDDPARRRRRRPRRRHGVLHAPGDPRRLLRDARARRRGGGSDAGLAAVRRDARGVRDGRGRLRAAPRGARARGRRAARGSTPRCSATGPRTTRTTWRSPIPSRSASRR